MTNNQWWWVYTNFYCIEYEDWLLYQRSNPPLYLSEKKSKVWMQSMLHFFGRIPNWYFWLHLHHCLDRAHCSKMLHKHCGQHRPHHLRKDNISWISYIKSTIAPLTINYLISPPYNVQHKKEYTCGNLFYTCLFCLFKSILSFKYSFLQR